MTEAIVEKLKVQVEDGKLKFPAKHALYAKKHRSVFKPSTDVVT